MDGFLLAFKCLLSHELPININFNFPEKREVVFINIMLMTLRDCSIRLHFFCGNMNVDLQLLWIPEKHSHAGHQLIFCSITELGENVGPMNTEFLPFKVHIRELLMLC